VTLNTYSGHRLAVNVPDDAATVSVTVELWSYDGQGNNAHRGVAINNAQAGVTCSSSNRCDLTYSIGGAGTTRTFTLAGPFISGVYASSFVVILTTIIPDRVLTSVILPADYSGVVNVTDAGGSTIGRRYVGEGQFVAVLMNATTYDNAFHCYCGPAVQHAFLVPRSVFFESRLYAYLNASDPIAPLDKLSFRQNGSSGVNSDALQEILSGNVTEMDVWTIYDLLTLNETGVRVRTSLALTNDLFLYSLPDDAVRFIAYTPPLTAPSWPYIFCSGSCTPPPPKPWWEQIWDGVVSVVVGFVTSAIILAVTAFKMIVAVLSQVGAWLAQAVSTAAQAVASAVQAAAKVLQQVVDWIVDQAMMLINAIIRPMVDMINAVAGSWFEGLKGILTSSFTAHSPIQTLADYLTIVQAMWRYLLMPLVLIATLITIAQTVEVIIEALSAGIAGILARVVQYAAPIFLFGVAAAAMGAVVLAFDNGLDRIFVSSLGDASRYVTIFLGTQKFAFTLLSILMTETGWMSGATLAILSILVASYPRTSTWWLNLLVDAISLILASVGLYKYLTGPSDRIAKVITPFVSMILGVVVYSSFVSWVLRFELDLASGAVLPP